MDRSDHTVEQLKRAVVLQRLQQRNAVRRKAVGVTGEMYIGGAGVARGYLNRPALNNERFLPDPFADTPDARMYKTGDLARYLPDGNIEFLGRNDFQVKIRGFRIELGEIEAQLAACHGVREAVVIAREDTPGDKRLVAYLTKDEGGEIKDEGRRMKDEVKAEALRALLLSALPEYMVPAAYVMLDSFPLTPNGKLDRRALPAPDRTSMAARQYEAPRDAVEVAIAEIWQGLLGLEQIGRHDHFFESGGHSLLAVQLVTRLHEQFYLDIPLRAIFEHPVLSQLADLVTSSQLALFAEEEMKDVEKELDSLSESELLTILSEGVANG